MRLYILLFLVFFAGFANGQAVVSKKPAYVIIMQDRIVTMDQVLALKTEDIKSINKGVTEIERTELLKKFGDKIGPKEFVMQVFLYMEEEKAGREKKKPSATMEILK